MSEINWEEHKGLSRMVLLRFIRGKRAISDDEMDEMVNVADAALWKASQRFDPERGFKWSTYACRVIGNELWRHWNAANGRVVNTGKPRQMDIPQHLRRPIHETWQEPLQPEPDAIADVFETEEAFEAFNELSDEHRELLGRVLGMGSRREQNFRQISGHLGTSRQTASTRTLRAVEDLVERLLERGVHVSVEGFWERMLDSKSSFCGRKRSCKT